VAPFRRANVVLQNASLFKRKRFNCSREGHICGLRYGGFGAAVIVVVDGGMEAVAMGLA